MRLPDGRLHPKAIGGPGATTGHVLTWTGITPKWKAPTGSTTSFYRDRFALASSGAQALDLSYQPKAYSSHLYLNGIYQDEGTDYVVTGSTVSVLSAMGATTGDVLEVRYAIGGIAVAPGTLGIFDDFDRADGPTDVPDRADGGLWTVVGSDWELADGRLIRTSGGVGSPISSYWVYADYGYTATVSVQSKFNFIFLDGGMAWYVATDGTASAGFAVVYDANFPRMELVDIATSTAIASPVTAPTPDGTERVMAIGYDYSSGAITVDIDGTNYFTETSPSLYSGTGLGLYTFRDYATYQSYYDDVLVTGT